MSGRGQWFTARSRLLARGRGALAALAVTAVAGCAAGLAIGGAAAATGQPTTGPSCPTSNAPNELTLAGGTPQTAKLDAAFGSPFQVALANTNGCPVTTSVAGTSITFSAPTSGASGTFAASGSSSVTVGTDAAGTATVQGFTANDIAGSYTLTASSDYGSVTFALTNTASGMAATITPQTPVHQAATVGEHYASPLAVKVLDANGNPVEGATVTFVLGSGGGGGGGAGGGGGSGAASAGASFDGGSSQATAQTNASGIATSPLFSANGTAGVFTATAAIPGITEPASFGLDNLAATAPKIELIGATHRSAGVGARYASPLRIEVVDAAGKPVAGATVTFTLGSSGAGSAGGGSGGSPQPGATFLDGSTQATATTGAHGRATSPGFSANSTAGTFTASVSVTGVTNPLTIELENLAGRAELVGGARRSAAVDSRYAKPLEVRVMSAHGTPVVGATVTFALGAGSAGGGGGSAGATSPGATFLGGSAQASATTSAAGLAVSPLVVANGSPGSFTATASVSGIANPLTFTLDNLAGTIARIGGVRRSATVDSRYAKPLEVRVMSAHGTPVDGATVTFALASGSGGGGAGGGGSAGGGTPGATFLDGSAQATETTSANGLAVSPVVVANGTPGTFTATASLSGVTNPLTFSLDNLAGAPPSVVAGADPPRTATVGDRYSAPLEVTVRAGGKPVEGATVTFTLGAAAGGGGTGSGGSGTAGASFVNGSAQATETTNADGRAVSPALTANDVAGAFTATASTSGTPRVATFRLRNLAGKVTTVSVGAAASEATPVGTRFPIRFAVTVKDAANNPVSGAVVTFSAPASAASGSFDLHGRSVRTVRVRTDSAGVAVAPSFTANGTPGGYAVSARVKGAAAVAFATVNQPSTAA